MIVAHTFEEARHARGEGRVGLVPTMGALHAGHRSLLDAAVRSADRVMASIFVNPLQFNDPADLEKYPRTLDADLEICRGAGVDVVFAPGPDVMYPRPPLTSVVVSRVADFMEGPHRPGHFAGVATVVAKLFAGLQPDMAFFGRKDAQQLAIIRTMAADLDFPVTVVGCPTLRSPEGLALSSRNVFLSEVERVRALGLSRGLMRAADAVEEGIRDAGVLISAARSEMDGLDVEYVELASQQDASPLSVLDRPAFLAVAAFAGAIRLIDNVAFDVIDGRFSPDRGIRVAG